MIWGDEEIKSLGKKLESLSRKKKSDIPSPGRGKKIRTTPLGKKIERPRRGKNLEASLGGNFFIRKGNNQFENFLRPQINNSRPLITGNSLNLLG